MISWTLPIKTVSEANCTEHWTIKARRHRQQQFFIRQCFAHELEIIPVPCIVTMTRLAPRTLDDDNLQSAFKYIRDELSECIRPDLVKTYRDAQGRTKRLKGRVDTHESIKWLYAQEKRSSIGIRIEISALKAGTG